MKLLPLFLHLNPPPHTTMSYPSRRTCSAPPGNASEFLLRDVATLLLTSELISSSLMALRPECELSADLAEALETMIALCDEGPSTLQPSLLEAGIALPTTTDTSASTLITGFFTRLPSPKASSFEAEVMLNLQLLAQHVELKSRLASEEAKIVRLESLSQDLANWSAEWRECGRKIGSPTFRKQSRVPSMHAERDIPLALPQTA